MSRGAGTLSRQLSLTEELEKLEQSITLTLQEIDANFSKAHRIVTTSILPLVEQYGEHSRNVWEASQFWKEFFEASANVSLSGYEEAVNDDPDSTVQTEESAVQEGSTMLSVKQDISGTSMTPRPRHHRVDDDTLLTDNDVSGSTPRPPATKSIRSATKFADLGSPYEALRREMKGGQDREADLDFEVDYSLGGDEDDVTALRLGREAQQAEEERTSILTDSDADESALLRAHTQRLPDMSMMPHAPTNTFRDASTIRGDRSGQDPLLHRVLDKNYRLQATPLKARISPVKRWPGRRLPQSPKEKKPQNIWDSPMSSPEIAAPTLRSAAFMSPIKAARMAGMQGPLMAPQPRTPGVSVQTPMTNKRRDIFAGARKVGGDDTETTMVVGDVGIGTSVTGAGLDKWKAGGQGKRAGRGTKDEIDWDSSEEDEIYGGLSPPKTIQFALPPSKLMQTPAREASKRIVEDLLLTAGAQTNESSEYSPSIVKMNENILDDSF